jgi:poly(beta-D-mannuronate) lyase
MEFTQAITHLPVAKPEVVAGQIHDADDDVLVIRLENRHLFVDENGGRGPTLTSNYRLGDKFTVKFIAATGGIQVWYNGRFIYTYNVSATGCYFKAGCYTQSNTSRGDLPSAYGQVVIYNLSVTHR